MKNNKRVLATMVAVGLITISILNTVSAANEMGNGTGNASGTKTNSIDVDNNGIADGEEDFDNDGILNKDDEDYIKTNENIRDDDNDGISNKDDEDYIKNPELDGTNKPSNAGNGENNNSDGINNKSERTKELKSKIGTKTSGTIDGIVSKFNNNYKNLPIEEQKSKYEILDEKINIVLKNIDTLNLDDAKREQYINIFEYLQLKAQEISDEL